MNGVVDSKPSFDGTVYHTKQGGFSDEVFNNYYLQDYMKGIPCGYIGSSYRKAWADKLVEKALRDSGLGPRGIAVWLTSTSGRHLADNIRRGHYLDFEKHVNSATGNAFLDVTVWKHPDHEGSLASTLKIRAALEKALTKK